MQKLLGLARKAIADYEMIADGDKIAVGLSGGKDSVALLAVLAAYRKFAPYRFDLTAINVDLGFAETDPAQVAALARYCQEIDVPFVRVPTDIAEIIFDTRKEKSPCSLCAKMRRGALNSAAAASGCNKLALGHHADDIAETFLMSLLYEGRVSTFMPVSHMDRSGITLIRPLIYAEEKYLSGLARRYELPVVFNPCPCDKHTSRQQSKELIARLDEEIPGAKKRLLSALFHPERNNLLPLKTPRGEKID